MKLILIILILLLPLFTIAQQSDTQLAYTYYQNQEYEKASELFLKLYERTRSSNFLDFHIVCLINGKQYDKAENALKKFLKADENNKDFMINLGYIYEQQGKTEKATEYYEKTIKKLIPSTNDINNLAYRFREIRKYEWAIKTYERGREILKKPDVFNTELGDCYLMERNYEKMFDFFTKSLQTNPETIDNITSKLSFARSNDIINNMDNMIEKKLEQIFKTPDYKPVFNQLAVWYNLQKGNYANALQHATLLNQKSENKIHIFLNIARSAATAQKYDLAKQAYNKVLEKGKENNNFYIAAQKEILNCKYQEYGQQANNIGQYRILAGECDEYIRKYGSNNGNVDVTILLADIYAYHLALPDSANNVLQRSETTRMQSPTALYMIKSKRADLLVFMDNIWEATILYTQIEKANPNNDLGYEAKLKKAWLAYYSGDLLWAKAQFDVLKGATTKLISNNAIKMSHFINSNYEEEGDNSKLEKLAAMEYKIYQKKGQAVLPILDSLIGNSTPGIADYTSLLKAKILCSDLKYTEAVSLLEKLKNESEQTYIQAEAIYELAGVKVKMQDKDKALELYKQLVSDYSGSVYSVEGGRLYREIEKN